MNSLSKLEELEEEARAEGLLIDTVDFSSDRIKGLYYDGCIALSKKLPSSMERTAVIAEELGHYHTSVGDILDQNIAGNRKQERQARAWGYRKLISLSDLISAYEAGYTMLYDIAEFLNLPEDYISDAIQYFQEVYGERQLAIGEYQIRFVPEIDIQKLHDGKLEE